MSEFGEAVRHERTRLMTQIAESRDRIAELLDQVAADEQRIEALDAYDRVETGGKSVGKSAKKGPKRQKAAPAEPPDEPPND